MAWRIVKQPNNKLARFSDIVDNFTRMDMSEEEAYELCREYLGVEDAERKVQAGVEDWKPFTNRVNGSGLERWTDCIETINAVHDQSTADECILIGQRRA